MTRFLFTLCHPGSEATLKRELAARAPALKPSFSRPGVVTFKSPDELGPDVALAPAFARRWGVSLGMAADPGAVSALLAPLGAKRLRLHVAARVPDEDAGTTARWLDDLTTRLGSRVLAGARAARGDLCLDVLTAAGEPAVVGAHTHGPAHSAWPGATPPIDLPADIPSRAYAKLEEALDWAGLTPKRGERALELGAAPGGATYALLRRGLSVIGVDTGAMAPVVTAFETFRHLAVAAGGVELATLPRDVAWFLGDMNLAPQVAVRTMRRFVPPLRPSLRGAILTLKMNDATAEASLPKLLGQLAEWKLGTPRVTQLPSNRREVCVILAP